MRELLKQQVVHFLVHQFLDSFLAGRHGFGHGLSQFREMGVVLDEPDDGFIAKCHRDLLWLEKPLNVALDLRQEPAKALRFADGSASANPPFDGWAIGRGSIRQGDAPLFPVLGCGFGIGAGAAKVEHEHAADVSLAAKRVEVALDLPVLFFSPRLVLDANPVGGAAGPFDDDVDAAAVDGVLRVRCAS